MTVEVLAPVAAHSAIVGGSSAGRVLACPGSIPLVASLPPSRSSPYAEEGTALHEAVAHILLNDLQPQDVIGLTFNRHPMDEALVWECLVPCIEAFNRIVGSREFDVEVTAGFPGIDGAFGTADVVYYDDGDILAGIIDWKFGAGVPVEAKENAQLKFYLAAMKDRSAGWRERLEATIVQPRHEYVETVSFAPAALDAFATELLIATRQQAGLHEGSHCRWCPAVPICPAKHAHLAELAQLEDVSHDLPHLLHLADKAELVISEIRALALDALEHGQTVEGWKLVAKRSVRNWVKSRASLVKTLNHLTGRKLNLMKPPELLSPAQVEKLIKPHKLPSGLTSAASPGNTLAPVDDPRPAVGGHANLLYLAGEIGKMR